MVPLLLLAFLQAITISGPQVVSKVSPLVPKDQERITGIVRLEVKVQPDGTAGDVRVVEGINDAYDQNAIAAVKRWKFLPATRNGVAVEKGLLVMVRFRSLQDKRVQLPENYIYTPGDEDVSAPVVVTRIDPKAPAGVATVTVSGIVEPDGSCCGELSAVESGGRAADAAVMNAIRQWKFIPAKEDGRPVRYRMQFTFALVSAGRR